MTKNLEMPSIPLYSCETMDQIFVLTDLAPKTLSSLLSQAFRTLAETKNQ